MKENFSERLKKAMTKANMNQQDLIDITGITSGAISSYLKGRYEPKQKNIFKLAKALGVNEGYLLGLEEEKKEPVKSKVNNQVPLIGTIAAGLPILAEENIEQYFEIDPSIKADFALKIKGDSMIDAGINDGDIAFLRKQQTLETGEIGAVVIENEATLKRFYRTNSNVILQPENKEYQPIIVTDGDLHIAGKLVAVLNIMK